MHSLQDEIVVVELFHKDISFAVVGIVSRVKYRFSPFCAKSVDGVGDPALRFRPTHLFFW